MTENKFSNEQLAAINELSTSIKKCQELGIHISGISQYQVSLFNDAEGKPYIHIS